jgi:two-component system sensor histidine kinase RegB
MNTSNLAEGLESENHAWLGVLVKIRWISFSAWAIWAALYMPVLFHLHPIQAQSQQGAPLESDPYWLITATLVVFLSLVIGNIHATKMRTNKLDLSTGNLRAQLTLDVLSLTVIIMTTGGATSPLTPYFLITIGMAAAMLSWRDLWPFLVLTPFCVTIVQFTKPNFSPEVLIKLQEDYISLGHLLQMGDGAALLMACLSISLFAHNYNKILANRQIALTSAQSREFKTDRLRSIGTLAAGTAHELNTPLATITMRLSRVRRRHDDDKTVDDLAVAQSQLEYCDQIVSRLLTAAGNPTSYTMSTMPIVEYVIKATSLWTKGSKGEVIVIDDSQNAHVTLPQVAFTLAMSNLLNNAMDAQESVQATDDLTIRLVVEEGNAIIYIRDHGCGLPKSKRHVGDPFFTTKPTGTGLGVYVARSVADGANGGLDYIREEVGTTAKWWFPTSEPLI